MTMGNNNLLVFTDLHLRPSVIELNKRVLRFLLEQVRERKPKRVAILGDSLHTKSTVHLSCLNLFQWFLEELSSEVEEVVLLIGNHDWGVMYKEHPFKTFKYIQNLTIVEEYYVLDEENVFISYCKEKDRFMGFLEQAGPKIKRIFAHMDVDGLTPGSGWEEVTPFLTPEQLKQYEITFSGHLHLAQEKVLSNGNKVVMVGTAYTTDFGESDQYKRIIEVDMNTGKYISIPTGFTMHKTLKIDATEPFPEIPEGDLLHGVEYRVIVSASKEQYASLITPKKYPALIVPDIHIGASARIALSATDKKEDIVKKYILEELKRSYGEDHGFDIEKLEKIAKRLIPVG